ncbi:MAG TPA: ATP-binding protein, partial [Polyangiaceae bacterium]|nr:ATP-binding protein [Polyangiaceae bacterium]
GEIRLRRRDGSLVAVEYTATANVFPGAHLAVWRDVDQRRRAERMLHFIADSGNELGRSLDYDATLAAVARLAVPLFADWAAVHLVTAQGLLKRVAQAPDDPAANADPGSTASTPSPMARGVLETGTPALFSQLSADAWEHCVSSPEERKLLRSAGVTSLLCVPLVGRGRVFGTVTLASTLRPAFDASDLAVAEEVGRRASIALENATSHREAHEANELKDQFLGTVSHELRTPLNAILGWVTLLRNSKGNEVMLQRGLQVIERNAKAQARLIDDVLDVSRIVSGKLQLQCARLDLCEVVRAALRVAAPSATLKGVVIEEGRCDAVSLVGDADRLQQVVWNLLSNAVKFTPAGGLVRMQVEGLESSVVVRIADSGQGLAPEFLPFVFDRFRQADSSPTRRHEGLGLGLAIAKNLVELHGGVLSVESAGEGRGTTFSIRLPRQRELHAAQPPALTRTADAAEAFPCRLDGVRVLVCDDHDDARELVAWVLGACGATVRTALSAREAIASLPEFQPQVLVSDVCMPERDGYSLLREVRALPANAGGQTPAVALTAFARTEDVQRALAAGFHVHLPKPVDGAELVLAVARLAQGLKA